MKRSLKNRQRFIEDESMQWMLLSSVSIAEDRGFNAEIFACVDETLGSILGEDAKKAMYHMISKSFNVPQESFRSRPLDLLDYLRRTLGDTGYSVIEKAVLRLIVLRFNLDKEAGTTTLQSGVDQARAKFLRGPENFETD